LKRIGPHNIDVISVLVGNLLGDSHSELRSGSPRFSLHMSFRNREYLNWLHTFFADRGYGSKIRPVFKKQIGKNGKIYYSGKFNLYTFSSLRWLYDLFYIEKKKRIPTIIKDLLTPQA